MWPPVDVRYCELDVLCVSSCAAAAVYDSTLNFRHNETPTLLGILNGKKYHADLYVRYSEDCNISFPVVPVFVREI